jgi:hypothetical protein
VEHAPDPSGAPLGLGDIDQIGIHRAGQLDVVRTRPQAGIDPLSEIRFDDPRDGE